MSESLTYRAAGVDIDAGDELVERIKPAAKRTMRPEVLAGIGGFGALFEISRKYTHPVLVAGTDGVGTKLKLAFEWNRHETIGQDLVAMSVNDILVQGAEPLFFLDYFACGKLHVDTAAKVVEGIARGCELAGCALIGGETAEMPGLYQAGDYDLAGFVVGIANRDKIIDGSDVRVGNKIIGLTSSGLHSNGYSLARKVCFAEMGLTVENNIKELGCTLGEELLKPTRIYVEPVLKTLRTSKINGLIHITGGGFVDNIPRVLPAGCKAIIDPTAWPVPPIFTFLEKNGNISKAEMFRTFNMGIGMMALVNDNAVEDVLQQFQAFGETPYVIGEIQANGDSDRRLVEIKGVIE